jgi:MerR family redox-sensitive transcriptional activator SoxR
LPNCALYNPQDRAAQKGKGPRYLMGDSPEPQKRP